MLHALLCHPLVIFLLKSTQLFRKVFGLFLPEGFGADQVLPYLLHLEFHFSIGFPKAELLLLFERLKCHISLWNLLPLADSGLSSCRSIRILKFSYLLGICPFISLPPCGLPKSFTTVDRSSSFYWNISSWSVTHWCRWCSLSGSYCFTYSYSFLKVLPSYQRPWQQTVWLCNCSWCRWLKCKW